MTRRHALPGSWWLAPAISALTAADVVLAAWWLS